MKSVVTKTSQLLAQASLVFVFGLPAQANVGGGNLLNCSNTGNPNWQDGCKLFGQTDMTGVLPLDSDIKVHYNFACSPGGTDWLKIGVRQPGLATQYFNFGQSGVLAVSGRGPFNIVDDSPGDTSSVEVRTGCSLTITSVDIQPTPSAVNSALAADAKAAEGWAKVLTVTSTNHAAFVDSHAGAYTTLLNDIDQLAAMLGTGENIQAIVATGGEPASQLLKNAVQAANDNGAFDLKDLDPLAYLEANIADVLSHKADPASSISLPPSAYVPNVDSCHNIGLCKSNVQAYLDAKSKLSAIISDAENLLRLSSSAAPQSWIAVDQLLVK